MFKLSTSRRLAYWKNFRFQLGSMPLDKAIDVTQQFWQKCPFTPFYLPVDDPRLWPDPWELITENYYCDLAKVLGIVYTLHLSNHTKDLDPEIRVYYDPICNYQYHIAYFADGKYVINLIEGEIVNKEHISQQLKLKYCYTAIDLKLEKY